MPQNALTDRYLSEFMQHGPVAGDFVEAMREPITATLLAGRTLSRPGLLERAQVDRLSSDLETFFTCLTGLPDRLFGGDLGKFAIATGIDASQVQAVVRGRGSSASRLSRADLYLDETGFRLMEMNMSSAIGGMDAPTVNRAMLTEPFVAEFVAKNNLGYVDTMIEVAETLFAECKIPTGTRPVAALCDWPGSYDNLLPMLEGSAAVLADLGIDAYPCHLGQLRLEDDSVWLGERKIDVVYRLFLMEDLLDAEGPALIEPVLRAAERGNVSIFSPMDAELYGSKGALAMLSDEANRHLYSPDELATLDRLLPWTRMVRPGPVTVDGTSVLLEDFAHAQQQELILKPTLLHGGVGVVPGWQVETSEWQDLIANAMDEPFVLQKRIHPFAEQFPALDGSGLEDWIVLWGAFLGARGYSGMFLRGTAKKDAGVLNIATGAIGTCCFHELA